MKISFYVCAWTVFFIYLDNLRRNVTESEFSKYDLLVVKKTSLELKYANLTLELQKEVIPVLLTVGGIIWIFIGAILFAMILLLLIINNRIFLKVLYKRYLEKPIPGKKFQGFKEFSSQRQRGFETRVLWHKRSNVHDWLIRRFYVCWIHIAVAFTINSENFNKCKTLYLKPAVSAVSIKFT